MCAMLPSASAATTRDMQQVPAEGNERHSGFQKLGLKQKKNVKYLIHSFYAECLLEQSFYLSGCWQI